MVIYQVTQSNNHESKQPPLVVPFPGRQIQNKSDQPHPSLQLPDSSQSSGKVEEKETISTLQQAVSQLSPVSPKLSANTSKAFEFPTSPVQTQTNLLQSTHLETVKQESPKYLSSKVLERLRGL